MYPQIFNKLLKSNYSQILVMSKTQDLATNLLYQTPAAFSFIFAGAALYTSEGDPSVRELLINTKQQLAHWSKMYNWGLKFMPLFALAGAGSAISTYFKTQEKLWLIGSGVLFAVLPYTFAFMMNTNNFLQGVLKKTAGPEVAESQKEPVIAAMKRWVNLHRGRVLLALTAGGIFMYANYKTNNSV